MKKHKKYFGTILLLITLLIPVYIYGQATEPPRLGVATDPATNITDTEATLNGRAMPVSGLPTTGYFRYSPMLIAPVFCNEIYGTNMVSTEDIDLGSGGAQGFSQEISGLKPSTIYYYCAIASNRKEVAYGSDDGGNVQSFRTRPCADCIHTVVRTKAASSVKAKSARLNGTIESTKATEVYFEYKKINLLTGIFGSWVKTSKQNFNPDSYKNVQIIASGLEAKTSYRFRIVAETRNPSETFRGVEFLFTTPRADAIDSYDTENLGDLCPSGWTGTPPNCELGEENDTQTCPQGSTGIYPNCVNTNGPGSDDDTCPSGWTGTPPDCEDTSTDEPQPEITCEQIGMTGNYPDCINGDGGPVTTCAEMGMTGTYPNCEFEPPTCFELGMTGTYPQCSDPVTTCAEMGMTGTYPNCTFPPPTCASLGMTGTYPACIDNGNGNDGGDDGSGNPGDDGSGDGGNDGNGDEGNGTNDGDTDDDGIPDTTDTDDDGDGIPDTTDTDADNDGIPDTTDTDVDGDGFSNTEDSDIDGDGIPNILDDDTDGDGIPNILDGDDDNDGIPDSVDGSPTGVGTTNDYDGGGIPNNLDSDMDGDGIPNILDDDTDGDGIPNILDGDDDNDGIPDSVDGSPNGMGSFNDYDGDGVSNHLDSDIDGDGVPNQFDGDTDGDGNSNGTDTDDDNDGVPDSVDSSPTGVNGTSGPILQIGDTAIPPNDAIVRYHEGVETVFIRQILKNINIQKRYGYNPNTNLLYFAYNLAHAMAKDFGYVDGQGREIRVSRPDVSAYQLRLSGNKLTVYEYYLNKIIDIRNATSSFKNKNPYEYYFNRR